MLAWPARSASLATPRNAIVFRHDVIATLRGPCGALHLRFGDEVPARHGTEVRVAAPPLVFRRIATAFASGLDRWSLRVSGLPEAVRFVAAGVAVTVVLALPSVGGAGLPRSVHALEIFFTFTASLMAALRFGPRNLVVGFVEAKGGTS